MNLTLAIAIEKLTQAKAFASDLDDDGKRALINEALEVLTINERYVGSESVININVDGSGILTLPREFVTIKAARVAGNVRDMASPWYEFMPGSTSVTQFSLLVEDMEDRWPIFTDPTVTPAFLKAVTSESGVEGNIEIHGRDVNGQEVWDGAQRGVTLSFNDSYADTGIVLIDEVIKPITEQVVYLYAENGSADQLIGQYEPGEILPSYRRYFVPEASNQALAIESPPSAPTVVTCLVQRRHVDMVADNDVLPLSNFNGLKHAVLHIHFANEGDEQRSQNHLDMALDFFSKELRRQRPRSEQGTVLVNVQGNAGALGLRSFR
jgi:hypothetical protein